jgi:plasmid stability protein
VPSWAPPAQDILSEGKHLCNGLGGSTVRLDLNWERMGSCAIIDCSAIIAIMASITIRNLEETTKRKLKVRAAMHGHSMEQEAREILKGALSSAPKKPVNLADAIRRRFAPLGGVELEPLPREPIRAPGIE